MSTCCVRSGLATAENSDPYTVSLVLPPQCGRAGARSACSPAAHDRPDRDCAGAGLVGSGGDTMTVSFLVRLHIATVCTVAEFCAQLEAEPLLQQIPEGDQAFLLLDKINKVHLAAALSPLDLCSMRPDVGRVCVQLQVVPGPSRCAHSLGTGHGGVAAEPRRLLGPR